MRAERARRKSGLRLNGTPQSWFIAFSAASTAPMPAHSAAPTPSTRARVLPFKLRVVNSCPITGNCPSAELTIVRCR